MLWPLAHGTKVPRGIVGITTIKAARNRPLHRPFFMANLRNYEHALMARSHSRWWRKKKLTRKYETCNSTQVSPLHQIGWLTVQFGAWVCETFFFSCRVITDQFLCEPVKTVLEASENLQMYRSTSAPCATHVSWDQQQTLVSCLILLSWRHASTWGSFGSMEELVEIWVMKYVPNGCLNFFPPNKVAWNDPSCVKPKWATSCPNSGMGSSYIFACAVLIFMSIWWKLASTATFWNLCEWPNCPLNFFFLVHPPSFK